MPDRTPFQVISEYCEEQEKNDCVRDLAYSIYRQQYESLTQGQNVDAAAIAATERTLLSPGSLLAHVRSAEEVLRKQFDDELKPFKARATRESFWFAVFTGIVGNIIYSLLLIILFVVAKDQLSGWLSSLLENRSAASSPATQTQSTSKGPQDTTTR